MTSFLLHWMNEELALHRKVHVIERDLCNGYLLAEILHLHGLEPLLAEKYEDSMIISVRVQNLESLAIALSNAGIVQINASTKREILMENRSTIVQLVLKIKSFLEKRTSKPSIRQQQMANSADRVYNEGQKRANVIRDIEERFVEELATQFHPSVIQFRKDVNMYVHQRKFQQMQWEAENEQIQSEQQETHKKALQSLHCRDAIRLHTKEKYNKMRQYEHEREDKWKNTLTAKVHAEQADLRLELTIEERRRRNHEAKMTEIQESTADGIALFERNMSRLGLRSTPSTENNSSDTTLRAIPATDAGPLAHVHELEKRVAELGFRPSNNVKMMKELSARRKSQLSVHKNSYLRRTKVHSDVTVACEPSTIPNPIVGINPNSSAESDQLVDIDNLQRTEHVSFVGPMDSASFVNTYLSSKREALEANYAQLQESGITSRARDMDLLRTIREQQQAIRQQRTYAICVDAVDALINLSVELAKDKHLADGAREDLIERLFLTIPSSPERMRNCTKMDMNQEAQYELIQLTRSFLSSTNVWSTYLSKDDCTTSSATIELIPRMRAFIQHILSESHSLSAPLSTQWHRLPSFKIVSVFTTSDNCTHAIAHRLATEHHMQYISPDELIEECVRCGYDPVKQAELLAKMTHREQVLGVFGPKIQAIRQKNNCTIPDALVVDIVVTFIEFTRRCHEEWKSTQVRASATENESFELDLNIVSQDTSGVDVEKIVQLPPPPLGCILHNYPRNAEELKTFEKVMLQHKIADEATRSTHMVELDSHITGIKLPVESGDHTTMETLPPFTSSIDTTIVIHGWETLKSAEGDSVLQSAPSDPKRILSAAEQLELEHARAREVRELTLEALRHLTHVVTIKQIEKEMPEDVLVELAHLMIDVYTEMPTASRDSDVSDRSGIHVVDCVSSTSLPMELECARARRRATLPTEVRVAWMIRSGELIVNESELVTLLDDLQSRDNRLNSNLKAQLSTLRSVIYHVSNCLDEMQRTLDERLASAENGFQQALDSAHQQLERYPLKSELILTKAEVALGDLVDSQRISANQYITECAQDTTPLAIALVAWLQIVPQVCSEVLEHAVGTLKLLEKRFYPTFPFLRYKDELSTLLPIELVVAIHSLARDLEEHGRGVGLETTLCSDVDYIIRPFASPEVAADEINNHGTASKYELESQVVADAEMQRAVNRIVSLLRCSIKLVETTSHSYFRDLERFRLYVQRDLRQKNINVSDVIDTLAESKIARWPYPYQVSRSTLIRSRQGHAQFLSITQLHAWIMEFRSAERGKTYSTKVISTFSPEEFVTLTLRVAQTAMFPSEWQDATALANVAVKWSSLKNLVMWRVVIYAQICMQFIGIPTLEQLESCRESIRSLARHGRIPDTLTRSEFLSLPLWFEENVASPSSLKELLFVLFTEDSSTDCIHVLPMLLIWCAYPAFASDVRSDIATYVLPHYARRMFRIASLLREWNGKHNSMDIHTFTDIDLDTTTKLHTGDNTNEFLCVFLANSNDEHALIVDTIRLLLDK